MWLGSLWQGRLGDGHIWREDHATDDPGRRWLSTSQWEASGEINPNFDLGLEVIHFCCHRPPCVWPVLWQPEETCIITLGNISLGTAHPMLTSVLQRSRQAILQPFFASPCKGNPFQHGLAHIGTFQQKSSLLPAETYDN